MSFHTFSQQFVSEFRKQFLPVPGVAAGGASFSSFRQALGQVGSPPVISYMAMENDPFMGTHGDPWGC